MKIQQTMNYWPSDEQLQTMEMDLYRIEYKLLDIAIDNSIKTGNWHMLNYDSSFLYKSLEHKAKAIYKKIR